MPLNISTTNSTDLDLVAVIDKIDSDGNLAVPRLRWHRDDEEFQDPDEFGDVAEGFVSLVEEATLNGFYTVSIDDIDGSTEMLRITIINNEDELAIGVYDSVPVENFVTPEVVIDLTVTEDRN